MVGAVLWPELVILGISLSITPRADVAALGEIISNLDTEIGPRQTEIMGRI